MTRLATREDRIKAVEAVFRKETSWSRVMLGDRGVDHDLIKVLANLTVDAVARADAEEEQRFQDARRARHEGGFPKS